jgi:hypothetical protein
VSITHMNGPPELKNFAIVWIMGRRLLFCVKKVKNGTRD